MPARQLPAWILSQNLTNTKLLKQAAIGFNISTAALVVWLTVAGTVTGISRYKMLPAPEWITANNPIVFAITGISAAAFLALITFLLSRAAWSREVKPVAELPFVVVKSESVGISLETSDQESVSPD